MADHRWWAVADLTAIRAVIFPENLVDILAGVGVRVGK